MPRLHVNFELSPDEVSDRLNDYLAESMRAEIDQEIMASLYNLSEAIEDPGLVLNNPNERAHAARVVRARRTRKPRGQTLEQEFFSRGRSE